MGLELRNPSEKTLKQREWSRAHYHRNREKEILRVEKWQAKNKEKLIKYREDTAERRKARYHNFYKTDEKYINDKKAWKKKEIETNPIYRASQRIRSRHYHALRSNGFKKRTITAKMLGCSMGLLKEYLASKFTDGMTWDNYGKSGWHIDHIIPLSSAKSLEELESLCKYGNLQPLWAVDNLVKGNRIIA